MDRASDEFLAGTAFAGDDNRHISPRNHLNEIEHLPHRFTGANKIAEQTFCFHIRSETTGLAAQFDFPFGIVQEGLELGEVRNGLCQEVPSALFDS